LSSKTNRPESLKTPHAKTLRAEPKRNHSDFSLRETRAIPVRQSRDLKQSDWYFERLTCVSSQSSKFRSNSEIEVLKKETPELAEDEQLITRIRREMRFLQDKERSERHEPTINLAEFPIPITNGSVAMKRNLESQNATLAAGEGTFQIARLWQVTTSVQAEGRSRWREGKATRCDQVDLVEFEPRSREPPCKS
jgi:hypothetical protein